MMASRGSAEAGELVARALRRLGLAGKSASLLVSRDHVDQRVARDEAASRVRYVHDLLFCMLCTR